MTSQHEHDSVGDLLQTSEADDGQQCMDNASSLLQQSQSIFGMKNGDDRNCSNSRRRDPVADWKAFRADDIPTKGGRNIHKTMPALFLNTLQTLENEEAKKEKENENNDTTTSSNKQGTSNKRKEGQRQLSILELGCGCGELSAALQLLGHNVHGIDVNEEAIQKARKITTTTYRQPTPQQENENNDFAAAPIVELGLATLLVADISTARSIKSTTTLLFDEGRSTYDFCVMQLLLSIVGGHDKRRNALRTAHRALSKSMQNKGGGVGIGAGTLYLSCSGVSDDINPNYKLLYEQDSEELMEEYGPHSYYSRGSTSTTNTTTTSQNTNADQHGHGDGNKEEEEEEETTTKILYIAHHFTSIELESLLSEVGFCNIHIERRKETSSRRPNEAAYFLYATAAVAD
mmetsp:Transcript_19181/g.28369  ORF Transcript_19181/g.28369 Transcript_19181/m.28369 type:complete len:403 (+) Transcript_19181:152-1360(+)